MAFKSGTPQPMKGTREYYERNYNVCRMNFLAVIAFTVISIITLMINDTYFLFSNYFAVEMAYVGLMYVTGNWQSWEDAGDYAEIGQEMLSVIGAGYIAVAAAVLIVLALCWVLSKKSRIPVIVAAVIMGFDTLYVLISFDIINIFFHAWVMYYLITAIRDWGKMQSLTEGEGMIIEGTEQNEFTAYGSTSDAETGNPYGEAPTGDTGDIRDADSMADGVDGEQAVKTVENSEDTN